MPELSPQAQFVASLLATPPTIEHEGLAMRLTQAGILGGVAGSLHLDNSSSALLGIAPQLLSITALQSMQHNPVARQEYARRFCDATASLQDSWLNSGSDLEHDDFASPHLQNALISHVAAHNSRELARAEVMSNVAAANARDAQRITVTKSNAVSVLRGGMTDLQRTGRFPGDNGGQAA